MIHAVLFCWFSWLASCLAIPFLSKAPSLKQNLVISRIRSFSLIGNGRKATATMPRVHVYAPEKIDMWRVCQNISTTGQACEPDGSGCTPHLHSPKHNVDYFFSRALVNQQVIASVPPEQADLFVIPGMCSQSSLGVCQQTHEENVRQLADFLEGQLWFRRKGGADHLLMCDNAAGAHESVVSHPQIGRIMLGRFEAPSFAELHGSQALTNPRNISVGYTTFSASGTCSPPRPKEWSLRRYDVHAIMSVSRDYGQLNLSELPARLQLACDVLGFMTASRGVNRSRLLVHLWDIYGAPLTATRPHPPVDTICMQLFGRGNYTGDLGEGSKPLAKMDKCEALYAMADARLVLTLPGDTPTTDRIFNAFETETPLLVVGDEQKQAMLELLPFRSVVPWEKLFVELDSQEWQRSPLAALATASAQLSYEKWNEKVELMRKYRDNVLWHTSGSQAPINAIRDAARAVSS